MKYRNVVLIGIILCFVTLSSVITSVDAAGLPFDTSKKINQSTVIFSTYASKTDGKMKIYGVCKGDLGKSVMLYLGCKFIPSSDTNIKIGFAGSLTYRIISSIWPSSGGTIMIHVVLCDSDMDELDSHQVFRVDGWYFNQVSGANTYYTSTKYTLDSEYELAAGETYYVCIRLYGSLSGISKMCSQNEYGSTQLALTSIAWTTY